MLSLDSESFLAEICSEATPADVFERLMPALGKRLGCDRTFLYLRSPSTQLGRVPFCWQRRAEVPRVYDPDWKPEPSDLADSDPMFAAALRCAPSIFVEDVEAASPDVLDREFEAKTFGHRALIHAHLCQDNELWGVLQPAIFGRPQAWSQADRDLIQATVQRITPLAVAYVTQHCPA
ncbi:MAG TPA: GAF domain-containing protein [Trichocoleus sp.]